MEAVTVHILRAAVMVAHDSDLAKKDVVIQLWSDGRVTSQKAGSLLGKCGLHERCPPFLFPIPELSPEGFPRKTSGSSYASSPSQMLSGSAK